MRYRTLGRSTLALLLGVGACVGGTGPVPVACGSLSPAGPGGFADTLEVTIVLAERPTRPTDVLVRVDPLSERGAVLFSGTPHESAAAVSASLTTDGVFQGCINERADGFRLRAEQAPIGRVWVKVSSNRPVAVRLESEASGTEFGSPRPDPAGRTLDVDQTVVLIVAPGASGRRAWPIGAPSRNPE